MMSGKKLLNAKSLEMNVVISQKKKSIFLQKSNETKNEQKLCKLILQKIGRISKHNVFPFQPVRIAAFSF